jgi:hypothetical protein
VLVEVVARGDLGLALLVALDADAVEQVQQGAQSWKTVALARNHGELADPDRVYVAM